MRTAPRRVSRGLARVTLTALALAAAPLGAQTPADIRAEIASARLGTGYAQMINLSATPDLSAASYRIDSSNPGADLDVLRVPYQAKWMTLSADADLYWEIAAGWLQFKQDLPFDPVGGTAGEFRSRWTAWSVGVGAFARYRLGSGLTLEPGLDVGLARLSNHASYDGSARALQPVLDGVLFNWSAYAWLVTPSVALSWTAPAGPGEVTLRGHVARSWIGSFDTTDEVQRFDEAANIYSLHAAYVHPTSWRAFDRPVSAVAFVGYAGFFGANRNALGFDDVAEIGAGFELPVNADRPGGERARFSASYLVGSGVWGWTVGVDFEF